MERLRSVARLAISVEEAEGLLPQFFDTHRNGAGNVVIPLHVPFHDVPVEVIVERGLDEERLNEVFHITWRPTRPGLFSEFRGHIIACTNVDDECTCLELDGHYEPPYGNLVGEALDSAIAHPLLQRTADHFLIQVAEGLHTLAS